MRASTNSGSYPQILWISRLEPSVLWPDLAKIARMTISVAGQPAFDPREPFTRAEGRRVGITDDMLLTRSFHKVLYDSWVSSHVPVTPMLRATAAIRLAPEGSRVSHHTAAEIWGAVVPAEPNVHLTVPRANDRLIRKGILSHSATRTLGLTWRKGLPVSSPEQAFLELAAVGVGLVDLVVAADSMIKVGSVTLDQLRESAAGYDGRYCRVARRAAALAREGVDSPMETRLRLLIVLAGLPEPRVNLIVRGIDGEWHRRYDLAYENLQLIIEYDGRQHASDTTQWLTDIHRREQLDRMHWRIVVITSEGIYRDPAETLRRIRSALVDCGAVKVRKTFKDEWRLHFPVS